MSAASNDAVETLLLTSLKLWHPRSKLHPQNFSRSRKMTKSNSNNKILSTNEEIKLIEKVILGYLRLPFSPNSIPGSIMEHVLGHVRNADVLNTYDFVDVVDRNKNIGWQVKSRKSSTPVTWKRAKITNRESLILDSESSDEGLDKLGAAVMGVCNDHLTESISKYNLTKIGYIDLILHSNKIEYIECEMPQENLRELFKPSDFKWKWSIERKKGKKRSTICFARLSC